MSTEEIRRALISRRRAIQFAGAAAAATLLNDPLLRTSVRLAGGRPAPAPSFIATVLRREDMLSLRFEFYNLVLDEGELVRQNAGANAFVVVQFAPQNIAEQAFYEGANPDPLPTPPVDARMAKESRLAFKVPASITSIAYRLEDLLEWEQFEQRVVPSALPPKPQGFQATPTLRAPTANETSIEVPWRLYMSPNKHAGWAHAKDEVTHEGRTELWHTRLGTRKSNATRGLHVDEQDTEFRKMRAIWAKNFNRNQMPPDVADDPFLMSLKEIDRWQLVRLTSDFKKSGYHPLPVDVDRFMMTPLGAWMNVRGDWAEDNPWDIIHWSHRATMGRDHYVRVVKKGYLLPFGHRAVVVSITERKFLPVDNGQQAGSIGAFLRQKKFVVVKQPERGFSHRGMPFDNVRILTVKTPDLDKYEGAGAKPLTKVKTPNGQSFYGEPAFWPRVDNQDFLFHLVGTDKDGKPIEFTCPLMFVLESKAKSSYHMNNISKRYEEASSSRRSRPMQGQKIALAPSTPSKPGDAELETDELTFKADFLGGLSAKPKVRPLMNQAQVRLQAVEQVKGGSLGGTAIELHPDYVTNGFGPGGVFAKLKNAKTLNYGADKAGDKSGGLVTPNMDITGFSRKTGPVGGPLSNPPPKFEPKDFFKGAKFLGIDLADIVLSALFSELDKVPKTISKTVYPGDDKTKPPKEIVTELDWRPDLDSDPLNIFEPEGPDGAATLVVKATFITPLNPPGSPSYDIVGDLRSFRIHMIGTGSEFMILTFNKLSFTSSNGSKPDVDVDIPNVEFAGVLSFVNELKDFLESSGTGFDIEITPTQVSAGYTLGLPTISVGIFSLQNISFGAGVILPFTGDSARCRFAFCERENQFLLTYTIFGGGGYFEIHIGVDGIEKFAAALEFGVNCSIDIGVASGGVEIMAGIYFEMGEEAGKEICKLTGYVRLGGELDILGIICMSLEFNLSLTYDFVADEMWGQASLEVEVEVLLFSVSVELTVEKKFGGNSGSGGPAAVAGAQSKARALGPGPPPPPPEPITFDDLYTETEWQNEYCGAFAGAAF